MIEYTKQHSADDEVTCTHAEIRGQTEREVEEQHKEEQNLEPVHGGGSRSRGDSILY